MVKGKDFAIYDLGQPVPLCGDIKIEVIHKTVVNKKVRKCRTLASFGIFYTGFHCSSRSSTFISTLQHDKEYDKIKEM